MTTPHRFVLLTLGLAAPLTAQVPGLPQPEPPKPTLLINGVVVDQDSRTPIPGARVTVASPAVAGPPGSAIQMPSVFAPTVADEKGRFEVRVAAVSGLAVSRLTVGASATGFGLYSAALMLTEGQSTAYVEVALTRLGSVKGVLVDEETRKPLAGLRIEAVPRETLPMGDPGSRPDPATSRSDGSFSIGNLAPAEFFLRISADPSPVIETIPASQLAGDAHDKSLEVPEGFPGYGTIYWPGGADADIPRTGGLKVTGAVLDAGEIRLVKRKLHNLSGVLTGCDSGASMQLLLAPPTRRDMTLDHDLTCGDGFRILNLPDGSFTLSAVEAGPPRRFAFQPIDAASRGPLTLAMSAVLPVQIEVELEGVPREKLPDDLKSFRPELQPESAPVRISAPSKLLSGAFEAELFPGLKYLFSLHPPAKYYLKQLSYNGVPLRDVTGFTAYGGTLQLIFSDHAGALEAKIDGGNASYLFAVRDGMSYADVMSQSLGSFRQLPGPPGSAKLQGLKPGRYRAFLSPTLMPTPDAFDDYLRQAASVTIEEDQTATVSLQAP